MEAEPEEEEFTQFIESKEIVGLKANMKFSGGAREIKMSGGNHILQICSHVENICSIGGIKNMSIKAPIDNLIIKGGSTKIYVHNYKNAKIDKLNIIGGNHEIWIYSFVNELSTRGGIIKIWANFENSKINKIETTGGQRDIYLNPTTDKVEIMKEGGTCNIHKTAPVPEPEFYQESLSDMKIPITKLKSQKFQEPCIICSEEFRKGDEVYFIPCNHFFHTICLREWIKKHKSCPICKYEINNKLA